MNKIRIACYTLIILFLCCKKPYNPPVTSTSNSYLVVEGVINSGSDSTIINLSKTVKLNDTSTINPLLGATVTVESDQNNSFPLVDASGKGSYGSAALNLSPSQKYRLHIITNGSDYESDFVAVKPTPPIDSIGYAISGGNVNLYLNTHDVTNSTRYYRWEYNETWQFHSMYESYYVLDKSTGTIVPRTTAQQVYRCFANDASSNILLTSTTQLVNDVVYQLPLTQISINSEKLETRYSILVKQYALTPDAYQFYQNIKKNTEQLGSIFDAQPTQLMGNIHNTKNANEPVIGYITVTNAQSKRIFISNAVLPPYTPVNYPYDCKQDTAFFFPPPGGFDVQTTLIDPPLTDVPTLIVENNGVISGYLFSTPQCVDCTLRGVTQAPPFWK